MDARMANAKRTIAPCTATIDTVTIDGVKGYSSECFTCLRGVKSELEQCAVVCRSAEQNCSPGAHRAGVAGAGRPGVLVQYLFRPADAAPAAAVMPGHGTSERPAPFSPLGQKPPSKKASSSVYRRSGDPRTVGDMRALGLRSVYITCSACGSASTLNVDDLDDDVMVTSPSPHVRCAVCGNVGSVVRPDWNELRSVVGNRRPSRQGASWASSGSIATEARPET